MRFRKIKQADHDLDVIMDHNPITGESKGSCRKCHQPSGNCIDIYSNPQPSTDFEKGQGK